MESSKSLQLESFKSKKILHKGTKPVSSDIPVAKSTDQSPWSSVTPEKPANPPRRLQNRRAALSLKEVRQAAEKLRSSDPDLRSRPDPITNSSTQQISSWPDHCSKAKSKKIDDSVKLPEKYEILDKFFNSLDSSIRLLRLKGSMSTFTNISPKVECLTDRRFSHGHLAQLKFLLPEAIVIKKVLIHDERTSCMKPDLHVELNCNVIDGKMKSESGSSQLRKLFRDRLLDFYKEHPEEDEIPEEALPEPFYRSKGDMDTRTIKLSGSSLHDETTSSDAVPGKQLMVASHLSRSFLGHFSKKHSRSDQEQSTSSLKPEVLMVSEQEHDQNSSLDKISSPAFASPIKLSSKPTIHGKCLASRASETPVKGADSTQGEGFYSVETPGTIGTPAKLISTPIKLMSATPALQTPKRCSMSPDDGSSGSTNKLVRRPTRSRSLKFDTPVKNAQTENADFESKTFSVDDDIFDILPENVLQQIQEKERKALEEKDPAISQAKWRQQMITCLPKLFDMIHFLFQSINRSVITKEELVHRIISSHLDITDTREVEVQLRLLQELVPEWIYERLASSGDILLCINKTSNPRSIRSKLMEAR